MESYGNLRFHRLDFFFSICPMASCQRCGTRYVNKNTVTFFSAFSSTTRDPITEHQMMSVWDVQSPAEHILGGGFKYFLFFLFSSLLGEMNQID